MDYKTNNIIRHGKSRIHLLKQYLSFECNSGMDKISNEKNVTGVYTEFLYITRIEAQ